MTPNIAFESHGGSAGTLGSWHLGRIVLMFRAGFCFPPEFRYANLGGTGRQIIGPFSYISVAFVLTATCYQTAEVPCMIMRIWFAQHHSLMFSLGRPGCSGNRIGVTASHSLIRRHKISDRKEAPKPCRLEPRSCRVVVSFVFPLPRKLSWRD